MASLVQHAFELGLIADAPRFVPGAVQYEVLMGSLAFGVADDDSDLDVYGFCVPPPDEIFPHLRGEIPGFDPPFRRFEQYQRHGVRDPGAGGRDGRKIDFNIYSIVKFFRQCLDNNPNMIDCLFAPRRSILFSTTIGERVRESRHLFLHRGAWPRFKGYAYRQMHKLRTKEPRGKRKDAVDQHGYDLKFGYHIVRLLNEVEQILVEGDLDLERNREQLKAIRRGDWTLDELERYFHEKERELEAVYARSTLPAVPDEARVKALLVECIEQASGSLDPSVRRPDELVIALRRIRDVVDGLGPRLTSG